MSQLPSSKGVSLALALFALAGCDDVGDVLDVEFDRLDVIAIDWEQIDSDFVFRIDNPNPIGITLTQFDYTLAFEGVEWLSGDDPDGLEIGASGSSEVALPMLIGFESLYEMVDSTRGEDEVAFTLSGNFGFDTALGEVSLPYSVDGGFPALRTPHFEYERVAVDTVGLTSATLSVDLAVDNDHGSNLQFQNFDYDLELEGSTVASGVIADLIDVAGASSGTVSIPVDIDYVDAGTGLYDALTSGGKIDVGITAGTDVDTPFGIIPLDIDESGRVNVDP